MPFVSGEKMSSVINSLKKFAICWPEPTNCLRVFDLFVGLVLKGLKTTKLKVIKKVSSRSNSIAHIK